jgi:hypothetical protein
MRARAALCALVLGLAGLALGTGAGAGSALPTIYVDYGPTCTFMLSADGGTTMTSSAAPGPIIPPGAYQVLITNPNPADTDYDVADCDPPRFSLGGPGVAFTTEFIGEHFDTTETTVTLLPSSTYVAEDVNDPGLSERMFSTAATGSSGSLVAGSGAGQTGAGQTAAGQVQPALVGSARLAVRGTLRASLTASGHVILLRGGKRVVSIPHGRWSVVAVDRSARGELFLAKLHHPALTVTGKAFTGTRTAKLMLTSGTWRLSSASGRAIEFRVS